MQVHLNRRRFLGLLLVGMSRLALQQEVTQAAALETCHWLKTAGPFCDSSGWLVERWCYRCCAGTLCWTEWCELRVVGAC